MSTTALREGVEYLDACIRDLNDSAAEREFTADEQASFDAGLAERARLVALIERHALVASQAAIPAAVERGDGNGFTPPNLIVRDDAPVDVRTADSHVVRDAAMRAIEDADKRYLSTLGSDRAGAAEQAITRGSTRNYDADVVARMLVATSNPAYETGFIKSITGRGDELEPAERAAIAGYRAAANRAASSTANAGGYGVPILIDPTVIITTGISRNPLIAACRVEPITTDAWKGVSAAQAAWSMDAEAAQVSDDAVTFAQPTVTTEKPQAFIPYSIEIGMDYPGFATEMGRLLADGYQNLVASQLAIGDGSTPNTTGLFIGTTTTVDVATDNTLAAADIDAIYAATPEDFRANGKWVMNVDVENEIRAFGSGTATSRFTVDQTAAGITLLNGKEVILTDHAPAWAGTDGQSILVYGDLQHFLLAQRIGMTLKNVDVLFGANQRPTGQSGFYAYARFGSGVTAVNAFRRLKNITT